MRNTAYTPIELSERIAPFRIKYKRLRADSGGPGEQIVTGGAGKHSCIVPSWGMTTSVTLPVEG